MVARFKRVLFDKWSPHARSELRVIAALLLIFWTTFQIVFFLYSTLDGLVGAGQVGPSLDPFAFLTDLVRYIFKPLELVIVAAGMLLCAMGYVSLRRVRGLQLWQQLLIATTIAFTSAVSFGLVVKLACDLFGQPWPTLTPLFFLVDTLRWLPPFGLWAAMTLTVTYNSEMRERERRLAAAQAQAQEARMRALRYQVNPHLLYNTLNSIAALILDNKNELAEAMVVRLSDFFRASLSSELQSDVPLSREIAVQRLYLEIEQMRFPTRLKSSIDIPEELEDEWVPSLILQPLIENSLKHAVRAEGAPTHLKISAAKDRGDLILEVADDGPGTSTASGTGVGLRNVRERLSARFGERAIMETSSAPGEGFSVRLRIPANRS